MVMKLQDRRGSGLQPGLTRFQNMSTKSSKGSLAGKPAQEMRTASSTPPQRSCCSVFWFSKSSGLHSVPPSIPGLISPLILTAESGAGLPPCAESHIWGRLNVQLEVALRQVLWATYWPACCPPQHKLSWICHGMAWHVIRGTLECKAATGVLLPGPQRLASLLQQGPQMHITGQHLQGRWRRGCRTGSRDVPVVGVGLDAADVVGLHVVQGLHELRQLALEARAHAAELVARAPRLALGRLHLHVQVYKRLC